MSKVFKTSVNNTFDFEISNEDISNLDVVKTSDTKFHVLHQTNLMRLKFPRLISIPNHMK